MKKLILAVLAFSFVAAHAQTADEVIQKYSTAMGGLDNFNKIKTAKLTGVASAQGNEFPLTVQIINGQAMRTDVDAMGQSVINVYKDGKSWKVNPFAGASTPTDATPEEIEEFRSECSLANDLMDYKARGYKVELTGQEDVDGKKAFKIKLNKGGDKSDTYFVDASTYTLVKFMGTRSMMGQEMELETYFSGMKDVGNLKFNMLRTMKIGGQTVQEVRFDKVELDVPVNDKIFNKDSQ